MSFGLLSACLFLGYFWFAPFHVLNLSHENDSVPSYVGHRMILEDPSAVLKDTVKPYLILVSPSLIFFLLAISLLFMSLFLNDKLLFYLFYFF